MQTFTLKSWRVELKAYFGELSVFPFLESSEMEPSGGGV